MSKYSCNVNGEVLDHRYKKINHFRYDFYLEDIYIGQIYRMPFYWSVVGSYKEGKMIKIDGLKTRRDAAFLLLKMEGYDKT